MNQRPTQGVLSLLGFILPLLQFFFDRLPTSAKEIFLFQNEFYFVSVLTAGISYVLIIAVKETWFDFPIRWKKEKKYQAHITKQNPSIYRVDEIVEYLKSVTDTPSRPFHVTPNTTPLALLPILLIAYAGFFAIGFFGSENNDLQVYIQVILYTALVAGTALALATHYISKENRNQYVEKQQEFIKNLINLAIESSAIEAMPNIVFVARFTPSIAQTQTVLKIDDKYYAILSDNEATRIENVQIYNTWQDYEQNRIAR